jgi:hypothetical protein
MSYFTLRTKLEPNCDIRKGGEMETLDAPVYEVKKDSEWYLKEKKRRNDISDFFKKTKDKYNLGEGFSFYHSEYFGVQTGTKEHELYKDEVSKNPNKNGFHAFKKRSKYFKEIKELLEQVEEISPFKSYDVFGLNNLTASQWIGDRWFFGVKHELHVKGEEAVPVVYKDYLNLIISKLD